jgi:pyridoxine kinase
MLVISIQSQVCWGHVGNSAAVFPMQAAGIDVVAAPTTLLSNHPRYPTVRGRVLETELVSDLLLGLEERGLAARADWIVTGYMGSAGNARAAAAFVARARAANPRLSVLCDPVMGDADVGFFVPPDVSAAIADDLVPLADVLSPNQFELGALTGAPTDSPAACAAAARGLGAALTLVTGCAFADDDALSTMAVSRDETWTVRTPRVDRRPGGTGDLFAALFVAARVRGMDVPTALSRAVSGVYALLRRTPAGDWPEMPLVAAADAVAEPERLFPAIPTPGGRDP